MRRRRAFQRFQFVIHRNTQRLEGQGGGIDPLRVATAGDVATHDLGQLVGAADRAVPFTVGDDRTGNAAALRFLAVGIEQVGQVLRTEAVHQPPRRLPFRRIESQVQFAARGETEAAIGGGKLIAGKSQVENHPVDRFHVEFS